MCTLPANLIACPACSSLLHLIQSDSHDGTIANGDVAVCVYFYLPFTVALFGSQVSNRDACDTVVIRILLLV